MTRSCQETWATLALRWKFKGLLFLKELVGLQKLGLKDRGPSLRFASRALCVSTGATLRFAFLFYAFTLRICELVLDILTLEMFASSLQREQA